MFRPQYVFASWAVGTGHIQRFLLIQLKPTHQNTKRLGAKRLGAETSRRQTDEGVKRQ